MFMEEMLARCKMIMDIFRDRWCMGGVNYAVNLIKAGHVKEAVLLAALPSYAKAVIVAEENMKNVTLNQDTILAQENAITQDMQDPLMVKYAEGKAKGQALYAFGMGAKVLAKPA